jgi:hypothetical protein
MVDAMLQRLMWVLPKGTIIHVTAWQRSQTASNRQ